MNEEEKNAIERIDYIQDFIIENGQYNADINDMRYFSKILNLIDKQNKVIDEMAQELIDMQIRQLTGIDLFRFTNKEDTKQYFIRKVEEDVQ